MCMRETPFAAPGSKTQNPQRAKVANSSMLHVFMQVIILHCISIT